MRTIRVGRPQGGFDALLASNAGDELGSREFALAPATRRLTIALPGKLTLTEGDGPIVVRAGAGIRAGLEFHSDAEARLTLAEGEYRTAHGIEVEIGLGALASLAVISDATLRGQLGEREGFELVLKGSMDAALAGRLQTLALTVEGQIAGDLSDLQAGRVSLDGNGQLDLTVHASEQISGRINGMGAIRVHGAPTRRLLESKGLVALRWD